MKLDPARWLPLLRARKRAVLCAVLPALALASAAGTACAATLAAPAPTHASVHAVADTHAAHHAAGHGEHSPAPAEACPHCPLESGGANVGHAACAIDAGQDDGGAAPGKSVVEHQPPLPHDWLLPAARAAPPLIAAAPDVAPLASALPLTLRYCSLLI